MKGAVYFGRHDIRCVELPDPVLSASHEMIVEVEATSICGSDLHLYRGPLESIMDKGHSQTGHELVGSVVETGARVARFSPGDRVTVAYSCSCGTCHTCRLGQTAHCETTHKAVYGFGRPFGNLNGTHAQYLVVPHADGHALAVPAGVDARAAVTLSCNLPTALIANRLVAIEPGETVALIGCGPTGLLALDLALRSGPARLVALEPDAHRLRIAEAKGAIGIDAGAEGHLEVALGQVAGRGYDKVIEVVGTPEALQLALALVRPGGTIAAVGVFCEDRFNLNLADVFLRDITLHMHGFANVQPLMWECLRMLENDVVDPRPLFTHEFGLNDIDAAFRTFDAHAGGALKVLIRP